MIKNVALASMLLCLFSTVNAQRNSTRDHEKSGEMERAEKESNGQTRERQQARETLNTKELQDNARISGGKGEIESDYVGDRLAKERYERESQRTDFQRSRELSEQPRGDNQSKNLADHLNRLENRYGFVLRPFTRYSPPRTDLRACFDRDGSESDRFFRQSPEPNRFSQQSLQRDSRTFSAFWIGSKPDNERDYYGPSYLTRRNVIGGAQRLSLTNKELHSSRTVETASRLGMTGFSTGFGINWLVSDELGTPRTMIDKTGALTSLKSYDYLLIDEDRGSDRFGRTVEQGYVVDSACVEFTQKDPYRETGPDYFAATYHSRSQGSSSSAVSLSSYGNIHEPKTRNRFSYTVDSPLTHFSPLGLFVWDSDVTEQDKELIRVALMHPEHVNKICSIYGSDSFECRSFSDAVASFGPEGVDNGVTISVGGVQTKGAGAETVAPCFRWKAKTKNNPTGQRITVTLTKATVNGYGLINGLRHEGSHVADGAKWLASGCKLNRNPFQYWEEFKAYIVASLSAQASEPYAPYGFRFPGGGPPGKNPFLPATVMIYSPDLKPKELVTLRTDGIKGLLARPKSAGGLYEVTPEHPGSRSFSRSKGAAQ